MGKLLAPVGRMMEVVDDFEEINNNINGYQNGQQTQQ